MSVNARFFASLKERVGHGSVSVDLAEASCVRDVWYAVTGEGPGEEVLVAINKEYADFDAAVVDGDEVAFFPPITGG